MDVTVPVYKLHTQTEETEFVKVPVVLPHELVGALYNNGKLNELCGDLHQAATFWAHFQARPHDACNWAREHPGGQPDSWGYALPLGTHGDDVRYNREGPPCYVFRLWGRH